MVPAKRSRVLILALCLASVICATPTGAQQQITGLPGISVEDLSKLTPQQRADLIRRLQAAGILPAQLAPVSAMQAAYQFPGAMLLGQDTTLAITEVDTTMFYVESPFDFGLVAGEFDSTHVLELFGRRMFQMAPETFEPSIFGPVGADYKLGPGDQIILQLWGSYQSIEELTINREGYIYVQRIGRISLAYLTLEQAKRLLLRLMTPHYQALKNGEAGATAWLDISLGKLRAITVFVMGDVIRPGAYTLSGVSKVFTALYAAGGPTNQGSLRDIRLTRGDREVARLDGYTYLLRGDPSSDIQLEDGDIVFINPIGPKVMVQGRVGRPAVYELGEEDTLEDMIAAAGGLTAAARLDRAQVARILPPAERGATPWVREYIDVSLEELLNDDSMEFPLTDGDVITIFPVPDDQRDFVVVEGAVWTEGRLQWTEGLTLMEAIRRSGGLREEALLSRVEVIRTNPDETTTQISRSLGRAMEGDPEENIVLERRDRINVSSVHDIFPQDYVTIYGQVEIPGEYLLHENMTVMDLIVRAGGLTKDAWTVSAEVVRMQLAEDGGVAEFEKHTVPIDTTYAPGGSSSFLLEDFDQVFIRQRPKWEEKRNVTIRGEVLFPGYYSLTRHDETVAEIIERAGGLTSYAYAEGARFYREFEEAGRINLNLEDALRQPDSLDNLVMQPGDSRYVPPRVEFVTVRGRVGYPSSVLYVRGKGPKYYIAQAGGFAEQADRRRTRVTLPNGSTWQPGWFILPDPEVQPGSEIFVPERIEAERTTWEVIRDTTALLSSFTTVLILLWQLGR